MLRAASFPKLNSGQMQGNERSSRFDYEEPNTMPTKRCDREEDIVEDVALEKSSFPFSID